MTSPPWTLSSLRLLRGQGVFAFKFPRFTQRNIYMKIFTNSSLNRLDLITFVLHFVLIDLTHFMRILPKYDVFMKLSYLFIVTEFPNQGVSAVRMYAFNTRPSHLLSRVHSYKVQRNFPSRVIPECLRSSIEPSGTRAHPVNATPLTRYPSSSFYRLIDCFSSRKSFKIFFLFFSSPALLIILWYKSPSFWTKSW